MITLVILDISDSKNKMWMVLLAILVFSFAPAAKANDQCIFTFKHVSFDLSNVHIATIFQTSTNLTEEFSIHPCLSVTPPLGTCEDSSECTGFRQVSDTETCTCMGKTSADSSIWTIVELSPLVALQVSKVMLLSTTAQELDFLCHFLFLSILFLIYESIY
jgi:hypothetical protein